MSVFETWWRGSAEAPPSVDEAAQKALMQYIRATLGLQMRSQDTGAIAKKVAERAHSLGLSLKEYHHRLLENEPGSQFNADWRWLIDTLTVTESYFFRDKGQFRLLRHRLLPEVIRRQRELAAKTGQRPSLRLWSAGCSSGEEAYSLAILLHQELPDLLQWNITILATDVNASMLERAQAGAYSNWSFRTMDPAVQKRYFHPYRDGWRIRADIQKMVTFRFYNLAQDQNPIQPFCAGPVDLILCRNVFIYFEPLAIAQALQSFYTALVPQGYLLTGHTELQGIQLGQFEVRCFPESVAYQRPVPTLASPTPSAAPTLPPFLKPTPQSSPSQSALPGRSPLSAPPTAKPAAKPATLPAHPTADTHLDSIRGLLLQRRYDDAIQQLKALLHNNPNQAAAHYWLAQTYANLGQHAPAILACQQALQADPLSVDACYLMAQIREEQADFEEAKTLYKRIIYISPEFVQAYLALGALYVREGNRKKALSVWKSALELVERSPHLNTPEDATTSMKDELEGLLKRHLESIH